MTFNYKPQFAPLVQAGTKRSTIRALRRDGRRALPGEPLHHFEGMRTKACRRLGQTTCRACTEIVITSIGVVKLDGFEVPPHIVETIAIKDGFKTVTDFFRFFRETHGLPFKGTLTEW
jgi:hypothetical protein